MIITATASRLSSNVSVLKKMILAGCDILRFNLSYGTVEEKIETIKIAQKTIEELNSQTKILIDLPNSKIRLGGFPRKELLLKEGDRLILKSGDYSENPDEFLPVQQSDIGNILSPEQQIVIDEGEIALKVINIHSKDTIECLALNEGAVYPYKGLNWNGQETDHLQTIEKIKKEIIPQLIGLAPDIIACPYTNDEIIAQHYKEIIDNFNWSQKPKMAVKIETPAGVENIQLISEYADIIILERGNLGIAGNFAKVGVYQNYLIDYCKKIKKPIFISTQILESVINGYLPQRSEISDLTNLVLMGVNGIVLCHETGVSMRPVYSIATAKKIITEAEKYKHTLDNSL